MGHPIFNFLGGPKPMDTQSKPSRGPRYPIRLAIVQQSAPDYCRAVLSLQSNRIKLSAIFGEPAILTLSGCSR